MTRAAFFDLDGTLLPEPSLERRLLQFLYWRREWTPWKLTRWVARYLKACALPSGIPRERRWMLATHGNKTYWKNVRVESAREFRERVPRIEFFAEGIRRMHWHASQGHKIFLVSGTLEVLAECAAAGLRESLRRDALPDVLGVCATKLAESAGRWTGEILGEAMWGAAKIRATECLAREHGIDLSRSFAYANSTSDRGMLAKVGHPTAVNPTRGLLRTAEAAGWPVVLWKGDRRIEEKKERNVEILGRASRDSAPQNLPGRREDEGNRKG